MPLRAGAIGLQFRFNSRPNSRVSFTSSRPDRLSEFELVLVERQGRRMEESFSPRPGGWIDPGRKGRGQRVGSDSDAENDPETGEGRSS